MSLAVSRRQFLTGTAATAALLSTGLADAVAASSPKRPGSDLGAVKHVVFLMMENRSFDHIYGTLAGVRGFGDKRRSARRAFSQRALDGTTVYPYRYAKHRETVWCTVDPPHDWTSMHRFWEGGEPHHVSVQSAEPRPDAAVTGAMSMGYYSRADLPFTYALADQFTVCDAYHESVLGPTHPNRLMWLSGSIDPHGLAGGPCVATRGRNRDRFSWVTAPELLEDAGISWKAYTPTSPSAEEGITNILETFKQFNDPASPLHAKAFDPNWPRDFVADIAADRLPAVSWIYPAAMPRLDQHAPAPIAPGEWLINRTLRALFRHPDVWAKTMVVLSYDEGGGFFDHVRPEVAPPGTPDEFLDSPKLPTLSGGITGPIGLGGRVPALVLSPWSRGGYVSHELFDHTSQLMLLEERFGIRVPGISQWRRRTVGNIASTLRFGDRSTRIPRLPHPPREAPEVLAQCTPEVLAAGGATVTPPRVRRMPRQEKGRRPVVR